MKNKFIYTLLLLSLTLHADKVAFSFYNDFFAGSDKDFTNGVSIYWLDEDKDNSSYTNFILNITDKLYFDLDKSKRYNAGISLSQIIVTPEDTTISTPQYNEVPYAGHLSISTYLIQWDKKSFNEVSLEIGVIGEKSMAESVQKGFHDLIGNDESKGWDNQLTTHYTANLLLQHGVKSFEGKITKTLSADWFNNFGVNIGNFQTSGFVGTTFRIGDNYTHNFNINHPYLKEEASLVNEEAEQQGFGWSMSAGINTELLAYSYILDTAYDKGYDTEKNILNISAHLGGSIYYDKHKINLFYKAHSPYVTAKHTVDIVGGILYSYTF